MNYLKGILSSFGVKGPQAVEKALQKVANRFTRLLAEFCKRQFSKSQEAERFSIVEEGHYMYDIASLTFVFIHGHQSTEHLYIAH